MNDADRLKHLRWQREALDAALAFITAHGLPPIPLTLELTGEVEAALDDCTWFGLAGTDVARPSIPAILDAYAQALAVKVSKATRRDGFDAARQAVGTVGPKDAPVRMRVRGYWNDGGGGQ